MAQTSNISEQLSQVCVGIRQDLHISRHLYRGEISYIVQDPVTFQHYRLTPQNYAVLMSISEEEPLGETYTRLVADGRLTEEEKEGFFRFILLLHQMNFLSLPISDDHALYERHTARRRAWWRQKMLGFLFLQVPVWNPDAFLDRTVRYVRPMFTYWCLALWTVLMTVGVMVAYQHGHELAEPIQGMLSPGNLPWIWVALFGLKAVHEFGHAYACKHYGGNVPEMGLFFIVFAPCAYMDASGSWNFDRKRERMIVSLGGMYFESFVGVLALFVWVSAEPGFIRALAYNAFILAGIVTVLFNINPLMRYDGYYFMSDLLEMPNLRARAKQYLYQTCKSLLLGLHKSGAALTRSEKTILLTYGSSSAVYRVLVVTGICMMVASRFFAIGIMLAVFCVGMMAVGPIVQLLRYLWFSRETAKIRGRAVAISLVVLIGVPSVLGLLPVRWNVHAGGVVEAAETQVVRAARGGVVLSLPGRPGESVEAGSAIVRLDNPTDVAEYEATRAALRGVKLRRAAYETYAPAKAMAESTELRNLTESLDEQRTRLGELSVFAAFDGNVIGPVDHRLLGAYVKKGTELASIASKRRIVRVLLSEEELARCKPRIGGRVEFRSRVRPDACLIGRIERMEAAGSRVLDLAQLTHIGGGDLAVKNQVGPDGKAWLGIRPYFEVVIAVDGNEATALPLGSRGLIQFGTESAPIGLALYRGAIRFVRSFAQS